MAHGATSGTPDPVALGLRVLTSPDEVDSLRSLTPQVHLEPSIARYVVALARATRSHPALAVGLSPRAATMLVTRSSAIPWLFEY